MKLAVIGSRGLTVHDLENYLPKEVTEIVSGGAKGIDACARAYAKANGIKLTEFLPEYESMDAVRPSNATSKSSTMRTKCWHSGTDRPKVRTL